jgi:flavodoxin
MTWRKSLKKLIAVAALLLAAVTLTTACSSQKKSSSSSSTSKSSKVVKSKTTKRRKDTLIVYFSLTGTTKGAAQYIQKQTGADMIRLRPAKAYGDYDAAAKRGDRERRQGIHPALATKIPNFNKYKTVFIGYPTWWARPPMLIHTLFDNYNFSGKTVIPFTTSSSTPISQSEPTIKQLAQKDGASYKPGIRYDDNDKQVNKWLKNLGY